MGRQFECAGRVGWPYLETELLNIRSLQNLNELRFIARLSNDHELTQELDQITFEDDNNEKLRPDIEWRAQHVGTDVSYWGSVESDIPWQLAEGGALHKGPTQGARITKREASRQSITNHAFFKNAQLVRDTFRAFHRSDGW